MLNLPSTLHTCAAWHVQLQLWTSCKHGTGQSCVCVHKTRKTEKEKGPTNRKAKGPGSQRETGDQGNPKQKNAKNQKAQKRQKRKGPGKPRGNKEPREPKKTPKRERKGHKTHTHTHTHTTAQNIRGGISSK